MINNPENRQTISFISLIILITAIVFVYSSPVLAEQYSLCSSGCDFDDITLALQNITNSTNTIIINESGTYTASVSEDYYVNETENIGAIIINATSVVLDCAGSSISGYGSGYGINVLKSNVIVQKCVVSGFSRGINVEGSAAGTFINGNSINTCDYGLIFSNSNNSLAYGNNIVSGLVSGILFSDGASNNIIQNSEISSSLQDISSSGTGTSNYVLNSSFSDSKLSFSDTSELYVQWFFRAYVDDSSSSPVDSATVNISNSLSDLVYSLTTGADGYTDEKNITAYLIDATGITSYNNHTFYAYNSTNFISASVNISGTTTISLSFDTTAPVISDVDTSTTNSTAEISWTTDDYCNSTFEYGTTSALGGTSTNSILSLSYSINLTDLLSNTTYYFNLTSCNDQGSCTEEGPYNLTTNVTLDLTAPNISLVRNATIGIYSVIINWSTNENSTTVVKIGTVSGTYTINSSNSSLVLIHLINISGLEPSTTYYYRVNSTDLSGNSKQSSQYSFTTLDELDETAPTVAFTWANQSEVSDWQSIMPTVTTNEAATCYIDAYKLGATTSTTDYLMTPSSSANASHYRYFNATADSTGYNNYFTAKCLDSSANYGYATVYFKLNDTTAPTFLYTSPTPADDYHTKNRTLHVKVTLEETPYLAYPKIKVDSGSYASMTASSTSHVYTYTSGTLAEGDHGFNVVMKDLKGNQYNLTRNYTIDITDPDLTVLLPDGKTLKSCNELELNLTMDEDGYCSYELFVDQDVRYDKCITNCDDDYDRCYEDAETTTERSSCTSDKDDCDYDCDADRYKSEKSGELKQDFGIDDCYDVCEDDDDDCSEVCKDTKSTCYAAAADNDDRDDCDYDYDSCISNCDDDQTDCQDDCDNDMEYVFFKDLKTECFDDASYLVTYSCEDLAGNDVYENVTFDIKDTLPPTITTAEPNGTVTTSTVSLRAYTDENARCKFSEKDISYATMENYFSQTGTLHSFTLNSLTDGSYTYYIRCNDSRGNVMTSSKVVRFTVSAAAVPQSPSSDPTFYSKTFSSVKIATPVSFKPDKAGLALTELELKAKVNLENVKLSSRKMPDSGAATPPSDKVYQYLSIDKEGITNAQIDSVNIYFRVEKSWLSSNGIEPEQIYLGRYTTEWTENAATMLSIDATYYNYQSQVPGLSTFAVMSKKTLPKPADVKAPTTKASSNSASGNKSGEEKNSTTDNPAGVENNGTSWWIWILLLCLVVGGGSVFLYVYMHRHPQQVRAESQIQPTRDSMAAAESYSAAAASLPHDALIQDELLNYIIACFNSGLTEDAIKASLLNAGHDSALVDYHLSYIKNPVSQKSTGLPAENSTSFNETGSNAEIKHYILSAYNAGQHIDTIRKSLVDAGHDKSSIERLIAEFQDGVMSQPIDPELASYIRECIKEKLSDKQILKLLEKAGHEPDYIKTVIEKIKKAS
jgi:PGF-pre-PGF domain-containing protein